MLDGRITFSLLTSILHNNTLLIVKLRYRFRFYPTKDQSEHLARVFGSCRYVYNRALRFRTDAWQNEGVHISYNDTSAALTEWKKQEETTWLNEISCVPTQQALRHLNSAFTAFFNREAQYPRFKKKSNKQAAEYTRSAFKFSAEDPNNPNLRISGLGRLNVRWSRQFQSTPTTVTITKCPSGKYFVTLCLDEAVGHLLKTGKRTGIDLGVNRLATLSNGDRIPNPKYLGEELNKLGREQRILSRKVKGSNRWHRQRSKVARLQEHISNKRLDHLHKVTTSLVREYDSIVIEDLNVRGMAGNHKIARSIFDAGLGTFRQLLTYKCEWYGKELRQVDRFFPSSKRCSGCGYIAERLPLSIREWTCTECQAHHDRDENAAKNILSAGGQPAPARGERVRRFRPSGLTRSARRSVNRPESVISN